MQPKTSVSKSFSPIRIWKTAIAPWSRMVTNHASSVRVAPLKNPYLMALRPRQWTKNLIVFAAPLFAFDIRLQTMLAGLLAFILFCYTSSSFYLINDLVDIKSDRQHPVKRQRPIASGMVSFPVAILMATGLLGSSLSIAWMNDANLGMAITGYALLQVAYNFKLKRIVILDIVAISVGFVLRAYAGAIACNILLSTWFLLCTAMLALFLGIEKRKAELRLLEIKGGTVRTVLQRYSLPLLNRMESTTTTGAIITYTIWSSGPQMQGAKTPWMLLTVPFVLYGIFRYQFLSDPQEIARRRDWEQGKGEKTERPEEILLTDLPILLTVLGWILTALIVLSLKQHGVIH